MKRAEQKAATRAALLDAAVDEFADRGFRGARIERIAERAGVTTGALYSHFDSKDALWVAVYETATSRRAGDLIRKSGVGGDQGDERETGEARGLAAAVDAWLAGHLADPRWFRLSAEFLLTHPDVPALPVDLVQARRELRRQVARWLTALADQRGRKLLVPADELALHLLALANGTVTQHLTDPETYVEGRFGLCVERLFTASTEAVRPRGSPGRARTR